MSSRRVFVVGHKNPDTDSIVSAVAYAELLRLQGMQGVTAARQGDAWRETEFILDRFGVPLPALVEDVRPHACDVMNPDPATGRPDESAYAIGRRLREKRIRALPLVDEARHLVGLIAVDDLAYILTMGLDDDLLDQIHLDLHNVVETLDARLVVEAVGRRLRDKVMVAAMSLDTMRGRLEPDTMLVMGDREDAQRLAIDAGVGALVITGGLPVSDEIVALAREKQVALILSPHHTFTTARLLNLSLPVHHVMRRDVLTATCDEPVADLREKLTQQRTIPVVDTENRVVGLVSRSDLINPVRHGVYLVDHNERSQTVDGLDEADLLGIIDHHRIADIQTAMPILFRNEAVGSTSTMIAGQYAEAGIAIPLPIAGILLGGIITDTVMFRSPTSTPRDQQVAARLADIAATDLQAFGHEIFSIVSDLSGRKPREIVTTDFKEFRIDDILFGVGYLETVQKARVDEIREQLIAEMKLLRADEGYASVLLMVVDIAHGETDILIAGLEEAVASAFDQPLATPHSVLIGGVMSRKKQVVPVLPRVARSSRSRP